MITKKLVEAGFEYVCDHKDEMLFRKRKRSALGDARLSVERAESFLGCPKLFLQLFDHVLNLYALFF